LNLGRLPESQEFMMNLQKILRGGLAAAASVLLMAAFSAQAAVTLTEGTNYKVIQPAVPPSTPPGKVEVVEVFWYACGHCYALEPKLEAWARSGKPAYVEFSRQPATWNDVLKTHARVFYTAELLGKLPQLHADIFREINVKGARLDTPETIEAYFVSHGVPKADFQKAFSSFAVESKLRRADDLNRRYRITGTPTVIVNGKYMTDVGMAGSEDALFQVINALAAKDRPKG
jgi:thiol:disulfide interchange protein DsbA